MPEIKEYTSRAATEGLRPTSLGTDAAAATARRVGATYREIGQEIGGAISSTGQLASTYMEHREISGFAADFTTFMAKANDDWNNVAKNADPKDPTVAPKFAEALNSQLEKLRDNTLTTGARQYADKAVNSFRQHMNTQMSATMMQMGAIGAERDVRQLVNSSSLAARSDPTSLDMLMRNNENAIDAIIQSNPNLKGAEAAKVRDGLLQKLQEETVKAAWVGKAEANPDAALKELSEMKPDDPTAKYMNSREIDQIVRYAKMQQRQSRVYDAYEKAANKALQKENIEAAKNEYIERVTSDDPKVRAQVTRSKIGSDDRLDTAAKENLLNLFERYNKPEPPSRVSAANAATAFEDMRRSPDDPLRIKDMHDLDQRYINGDFTKEDYKFLRGEMEKRDIDGNPVQVMQKALLDSVKPALTKATPFTPADPIGASQYFSYTQFVRSKVDEYRKAGKPVSDLFDPGKPDYLGRQEVIDKFSHSMQDTVQYMMDQMSRPKQTRIPAPNEQPNEAKDQSRIGPVVGGPSVQGPDGKWYYRTKDGLFEGRKAGEK